MVRVKKAIISLLVFAVLAATVIAVPVGGTKKVFAKDSQGRAVGVDVSNWNGNIDWATAKANGVDFAIIRIGWGDDLYYQDDSTAAYNMQQCEKYGIPYGVYIYSYAISTAEVDSEIAHTVRMIQGHNPTLGIWFDMEDADSYKANHNFNPYTHGSQLTDFCLRYLRGMKAKGYSRVGVYANPDYFNNVLNYSKIKAEGMIWLAMWPRLTSSGSPAYEPDYAFDMWQYRSDGVVKGITGNGVVDMNLIYPNSILYGLIPTTNGQLPDTTVVIDPIDDPLLNEDPDDPGSGNDPSTTPTDPDDPNQVYQSGDANGDGKVSALDYVAIKNHIMKQQIITDSDKLISADANKDGKISALDYVWIKNLILNRNK